MNSNDLISYMNRKFAMNPWPEKFEVDMETYGHVIEAIIKNKMELKDYAEMPGMISIELIVGKSGGLMFKGVELIPIKDLHEGF